MNPRNTAILALVVVALGAFVCFYEIGGEEERAREKEAENRIFAGVTADAITAISLVTNDGVTARLERGEEHWGLTEPVAFWAKSLAIDGIASALADLTSKAVFDEPEPLEEYGLDGEPAVRFWEGEAAHELRIGDKSPIGGNTYVASEDTTRVYAVETYLVNAMDKSLGDLRDPRVLDFDRESVSGFDASWPGGRVSLERSGENWLVTAPVEAAADGDTVDSLLSTLLFMRADGFEDSPPSDGETGLDAPSFQVELHTTEGADPVRLAIGSHTLGARRLARGRSETTLYLIDESRLEDFPRELEAYRFKQLAEFSEEDAARFELVYEEGGVKTTVTGERGESGWETSPEPMAAGKARRLVSELSDLEAEGIAADAMGDEELAGLGLKPPRLTMRVLGEASEGEEPTRLAQVHLGSSVANRGIAAQREGDEVVYWLAYGLGEHIPVSLEAFNNRFVSEEEPETLDSETPDLQIEEPAASP